MYPEFGNYQAVILSAGTHDVGVLGNGITAATVNRFYCVSAGTMTVTMMGGGTFTTAPMTPGQELYAVASNIVVNGSGSFVGFKPKRMFGAPQRLTP